MAIFSVMPMGVSSSEGWTGMVSVDCSMCGPKVVVDEGYVRMCYVRRPKIRHNGGVLFWELALAAANHSTAARHIHPVLQACPSRY